MFRNRISHLLRAEYKGILDYIYLRYTKLKQVEQYLKINHEVFVTAITRYYFSKFTEEIFNDQGAQHSRNTLPSMVQK